MIAALFKAGGAAHPTFASSTQTEAAAWQQSFVASRIIAIESAPRHCWLTSLRREKQQLTRRAMQSNSSGSGSSGDGSFSPETKPLASCLSESEQTELENLFRSLTESTGGGSAGVDSSAFVLDVRREAEMHSDRHQRDASLFHPLRSTAPHSGFSPVSSAASTNATRSQPPAVVVAASQPQQTSQQSHHKHALSMGLQSSPQQLSTSPIFRTQSPLGGGAVTIPPKLSLASMSPKLLPPSSPTQQHSRTATISNMQASPVPPPFSLSMSSAANTAAPIQSAASVAGLHGQMSSHSPSASMSFSPLSNSASTTASQIKTQTTQFLTSLFSQAATTVRRHSKSQSQTSSGNVTPRQQRTSSITSTISPVLQSTLAPSVTLEDSIVKSPISLNADSAALSSTVSPPQLSNELLNEYCKRLRRLLDVHELQLQKLQQLKKQYHARGERELAEYQSFALYPLVAVASQLYYTHIVHAAQLLQLEWHYVEAVTSQLHAVQMFLSSSSASTTSSLSQMDNERRALDEDALRQHIFMCDPEGRPTHKSKSLQQLESVFWPRDAQRVRSHCALLYATSHKLQRKYESLLATQLRRDSPSERKMKLRDLLLRAQKLQQSATEDTLYYHSCNAADQLQWSAFLCDQREMEGQLLKRWMHLVADEDERRKMRPTSVGKFVSLLCTHLITTYALDTAVRSCCRLYTERLVFARIRDTLLSQCETQDERQRNKIFRQNLHWLRDVPPVALGFEDRLLPAQYQHTTYEPRRLTTDGQLLAQSKHLSPGSRPRHGSADYSVETVRVPAAIATPSTTNNDAQSESAFLARLESLFPITSALPGNVSAAQQLSLELARHSTSTLQLIGNNSSNNAEEGSKSPLLRSTAATRTSIDHSTAPGGIVRSMVPRVPHTFPYAESIHLLAQVNDVHAPADTAWRMRQAVQTAYKQAQIYVDEHRKQQQQQSKDNDSTPQPATQSFSTLSADSMFPVMVWLVIHANLLSIHTALGHIERFLPEDARNFGETAMCCSLIEAAVTHCTQLKETDQICAPSSQPSHGRQLSNSHSKSAGAAELRLQNGVATTGATSSASRSESPVASSSVSALDATQMLFELPRHDDDAAPAASSVQSTDSLSDPQPNSLVSSFDFLNPSPPSSDPLDDAASASGVNSSSATSSALSQSAASSSSASASVSASSPDFLTQ